MMICDDLPLYYAGSCLSLFAQSLVRTTAAEEKVGQWQKNRYSEFCSLERFRKKSGTDFLTFSAPDLLLSKRFFKFRMFMSLHL
jgi:hypothetical protein